MLKKLLLVLMLINSTVLHAEGHETGNGGDTHLGRHLLAQHIAEVIFKRVSANKLREIFVDESLFKMVTQNFDKWPRVISGIKFNVTEKMLYEAGKEKASISVENSNQVAISKAYFEKYSPNFDEVVINVIHEAGHKLGIREHQSLDQIGAILVTKVYKYSDMQDEWLQYLHIEKSIQAGFEARLKAAGYEYLNRGEGIDLAYFLYNFSRFNLMNSNLSQIFRYMAQAMFNVNIKKQVPESNDRYWQFQVEVQKHFGKELALYVRSIPREKGLLLIKYGMAKLKVAGLLYTECPDEFGSLAEELYTVLQDKNVDLETTSVNVLKFVRTKFYLYL